MAVAANAAEAIETLADEFAQESDCRITLTIGSTGKLYAQILHGAPFDLFLAADEERPRLLVEEGLAVEDSRRTYAIGRLVLWSPDPTVPIDADTLRNGSFRRLAIANPDLAPYGAAARDTLRDLGLWERLRSRIVVGENVGQAFAMTASGNAELGFVALASLSGRRRPGRGSDRQGGDREGSYRQGRYWEVPARLHQPIRQDAVLLRRAEDNQAARAFLRFLGSPASRQAISAAGYRVE